MFYQRDVSLHIMQDKMLPIPIFMATLQLTVGGGGDFSLKS